MPALLTAIVITCGALKGPDLPLVCRAQMYHGIYLEPKKCTLTASQLAEQFERNVIASGQLTRTSSYAECSSAADDLEIASYLPKFMQDRFGADSVIVRHLDMIDGKAIERKVAAKKVVKGAQI